MVLPSMLSSEFSSGILVGCCNLRYHQWCQVGSYLEFLSVNVVIMVLRVSSVLSSRIVAIRSCL
jgi:hypothetical protein